MLPKKNRRAPHELPRGTLHLRIDPDAEIYILRVIAPGKPKDRVESVGPTEPLGLGAQEAAASRDVTPPPAEGACGDVERY